MGHNIFQGTYVIKNSTFDVSVLTALPLLSEGWYWKIKAKIIDDAIKQVVLCTYSEAQIAPI